MDHHSVSLDCHRVCLRANGFSFFEEDWSEDGCGYEFRPNCNLQRVQWNLVEHMWVCRVPDAAVTGDHCSTAVKMCLLAPEDLPRQRLTHCHSGQEVQRIGRSDFPVGYKQLVIVADLIRITIHHLWRRALPKRYDEDHFPKKPAQLPDHLKELTEGSSLHLDV